MSPRLPMITILAAKLPYLLQALPRPLPPRQLPPKFQPQPQPLPLVQAPGTRTYPKFWRNPGLNESGEGLQGPSPTLLSSPIPASPPSYQGHLAPLSWLCSSRRFPSCQVWWTELQMGPKGVAEPHCLNQCPAHPFPQAPGCLPQRRSLVG
jgi:hypothetical protein